VVRILLGGIEKVNLSRVSKGNCIIDTSSLKEKCSSNAVSIVSKDVDEILISYSEVPKHAINSKW
jgi:hypothetical protein